MILRPARPEDAADIARIANHFVAETLVTFTTVQRRPEEVAADIEARRPAYLVLDTGASVEGFATYGPFRGGPGYAATCEHTILMSEAIRGQGGGRLLLTRLMEVAKDEGKHVMVGGVSGANPKGIAFHAAMGFAEVARMPQVGRKQDQWLDLILMQKIL